METDYRVCTGCKIHHYENCNSCFGFGVYTIPKRGNELFPIIAAEAHKTVPVRAKELGGKLLPCPECKSTIKGAPSREKNQTT